MRPPRAADVETIVAAATPLGRGALAVVRLSGPRALSIARAVAPGLSGRPAPRRATLVDFSDSRGRRFDRGLLTFFPAPRSYTGEEMVECSLHGNPLLVRQFLDAAVAAGARLARAGEFSRRAFLNARMDLVEAEAVAELIEARGAGAAQAALARLSGGLAGELAALREELLGAHALWTAAVDFPEQTGPEDTGAIARHLDQARELLDLLLSRAGAARRMFQGIRVAILGRPNAGKSSVFNALLGRPRAIVASRPGTTRDTLEEEIEIGEVLVRLIDTAGIRETGEPVEAEGVARARRESELADVILYVHDAGQPWEAAERAFWEEIPAPRRILLNNKSDISSEFAVAGGLACCAISPEAPEQLRALLKEGIFREFHSGEGIAVVSERQINILTRARAETEHARQALARGTPAPLAISHVEEALGALAAVTGEATPEEVLDRIFAAFCIGK